MIPGIALYVFEGFILGQVINHFQITEMLWLKGTVSEHLITSPV